MVAATLKHVHHLFRATFPSRNLFLIVQVNIDVISKRFDRLFTIFLRAAHVKLCSLCDQVFQVNSCHFCDWRPVYVGNHEENRGKGEVVRDPLVICDLQSIPASHVLSNENVIITLVIFEWDIEWVLQVAVTGGILDPPRSVLSRSVALEKSGNERRNAEEYGANYVN